MERVASWNILHRGNSDVYHNKPTSVKIEEVAIVLNFDVGHL